MTGIDYNLGMWLLALLPILLMFVLMLALHWGASGAAAVSMLASMALAYAFFGADLQLLAVESAKGIWSSVGILIVIWPAILIYEVTAEAKAFEPIRLAIERFSPNKLLQILAIGWVFSSFLQGVTGFGVPVAVVAPLLVAMGVKPVWAVVIPLLGQAWGNTFGTLAAAWDAMQQQAQMEHAMLLRTALWTGVFLWIVNALTGAAICWYYGKRRGLMRGLPAVLVITAIQGGGELLLSQLNQQLCCFLPSCLSLCAIFTLGKLRLYRESWSLPDSAMMQAQPAKPAAPKAAHRGLRFNQAFFPYYLLTGITLAVLLIGPLNRTLSRVELAISFPETSTELGIVNAAAEAFSPLTPFTNPGVFLLLAAIGGYVFFRSKGCYDAKSAGRIVSNLLGKTIPSTLTIVALVVMSRIMSGSGQISVLAQGTARVAGGIYGILAPFIGLLGTFVTASNVSSNILFTQFQQGIAALLQMDTAVILAAQTAGASIGSIISPAKLVLGTSTVGILGEEDAAMKKLLPFALVSAALLGLISLLYTSL